MIYPSSSAAWIETAPDAFGESYGQKAFSFRHRLADHPLFRLERLVELARILDKVPNGIVYNSSSVSVGQRWDQTPKPELNAVETLRNIESTNGWVVLKQADHDPEYRALLDACLDEMEAACGKTLRDLVKRRNAIVFVSSPNRITNYHIDREWNSLLQISGTKRVSIFDRADREVLPEEEIERFWTVDNNAAIWKPHLEDRARVFDLGVGDAVHIPVNSPHWVKNGPQVSVSLSVNFHLRDTLLGDVYRVNYWLRRAGLNPKPPGRARWLDAAKRTSYGSARTIRDLVRGRRV